MTPTPITSLPSPPWFAMREALWPDLDPAENLAGMEDLVSNPNRYAQFLATDGAGEALGMIEVSIRSDYVNGCDTSPVGFLEGLYVMPGARRRGVAKLLVEAAKAWARERGLRELASDTPIDNALSQRVHQKLGFAEREHVVYFRVLL